ncbi:unnamed protein product [Kluyveromyces dobzhanskii CBS 2104]|uniref:WGS project CCBQ000000000 data, contig 00058 n=1 Tax=Kluyveromyces dobzhanskii CBS 2104 TaxID=1427455 RepID=A0A0A8LB87_9SACH|nr:unnamed protein product [Kluyveromyces dobzhanskii CBS 2104]
MAKVNKAMSKEYISDSDSDNDGSSEAVADVFVAPKNYKKCTHLKSFVKPKNLKQKELWLIKLPKSLDISKLAKLPIDFTAESETDIEQKGKHFSVKEELQQENTTSGVSPELSLLTPVDKTKLTINSTASKSFDKIFTISEKPTIPSIDFSKVRVDRKDVLKVKGLKTRHFATGYYDDKN